MVPSLLQSLRSSRKGGGYVAVTESTFPASRRKPKDVRPPEGREEASPLAGLMKQVRFLRLPPERRASFGFLLKEGRPSAFCKKLHLWRLSEGSARGSRRKQLFPSASFGFLREASPLAGWRLSEGSARGSRRKQLFYERPSGSFTSGGFPKEANVLREASPLAAFRRKRTSFGKLNLWRRPSASFGKLHLWRGGGFLKEALRPSASFGKLHLWRGGGFPKEANVLREALPLAASFGKRARIDLRLRGTLYRR